MITIMRSLTVFGYVRRKNREGEGRRGGGKVNDAYYDLFYCIWMWRETGEK